MSRSSVNRDELLALLRFVGEKMVENSDILRELDAKWGDGDLGNTTTRGFNAINDKLDDWKELSLDRLVKKAGMTFNKAAASTFGVFFATSFMEAAKELNEVEEINPSTLCDMMNAACEGIAERGNSEPGDKTLLDALVPATEAVCTAAEDNSSLHVALDRAETAAKKGVKRTEGMEPQQGRATWLGEEARKVQDPGAKFVHVFIKYCKEYLEEL